MELSYKEARAFASVKTADLLFVHLNMTRSMLPFHQRIAFYHPQLDVKRRMLRSDDGRLVLVWQLRDNPYLAPSDMNIQSSTGTVQLHFVDPLASNQRIAEAIDRHLKLTALRTVAYRIKAQTPLLAA